MECYLCICEYILIVLVERMQSLYSTEGLFFVAAIMYVLIEEFFLILFISDVDLHLSCSVYLRILRLYVFISYGNQTCM